MSVLKAAISVTVTLAVISAVTGVLLYFKLATLGPVHPIFLYLLPAALVVMLYGPRPALLAVVTAVICADYFLYDPIFVFDIPGREEVSDVACFALLALLAIKCVHELFRPSEGSSGRRELSPTVRNRKKSGPFQSRNLERSRVKPGTSVAGSARRIRA